MYDCNGAGSLVGSGKEPVLISQSAVGLMLDSRVTS